MKWLLALVAVVLLIPAEAFAGGRQRVVFVERGRVQRVVVPQRVFVPQQQLIVVPQRFVGVQAFVAPQYAQPVQGFTAPAGCGALFFGQ